MRTILFLLAVSSPALAAIAPPAGVSATMSASADEVPAFALHAQGERVFECKPLPNDPGRYMWAFSSPDATLYDAGRPIARSVSEDVFEAIDDRSTVTGSFRSRQDGGPGNLPWVLLHAQSTPDTGLFAGVTTVQRVNTSGGVAPSEGCDADNVGKEARSPFSADYYFYRRRG